MGILNVTPDSFSDGGAFVDVDEALQHAENMISEGADILDVGGESARPGSAAVSTPDEIGRVVPIILKLANKFETPISIDTTKSEVAKAAIDAGAEIINDISGLRFDDRIGEVAADTGAGLVLMHSRGAFDEMHAQPAVNDIVSEVVNDLHRAVGIAIGCAVGEHQIVLDPGLGFGKTFEQNLEILGNLDKIVAEFNQYPMLAGASRKSFIGKILGDVPAGDRLAGSLAAAIIAVRNGASIIRVHDVAPTVQALMVSKAIDKRSNK
ncbi:MAG: dihydropteroate synthase [Pyrinomonadaceae bacterium]